MGVDGIRVEELPLSVQADDLAARPKAGVYGQHAFLPQWGRQEELSEVLGEDAYGLVVRPSLELRPELRLHGGAEEALVSVGHGQGDASLPLGEGPT